MKRITFLIIITVIALLVTSIPAFADGGTEATAVYGTPERIDGKLDDGWNSAASYSANHHDSGDPTDISAEWKVMYDETYLYFLVDVSDPTIGDADYERAADGDLWNRNTVHIMLDLGNEKTTYYDLNDFYYDFNARGYFWGHYMNQDNYWTFAVEVRDGGYTVEAALDLGIWSDFIADKGTEFGLDIWANDNICDGGGRRDFVTWSGYGDTWTNPSNMGTVTLGDKPKSAGHYNGVVKGEDIRKGGAELTAITNAIDLDPSAIIDKNKTTGQNVDTFNRSYSDDLGVWFGATFGGEYEVCTVVFWEGGHWGDGGWFGSAPKIQALVGGEWQDVNTSVTPAYPGDSREAQGNTHESYIFIFDEPLSCSGVRIVGANNSLAGHVSITELEIFTPFDEPEPVEFRITGGGSATVTEGASKAVVIETEGGDIDGVTVDGNALTEAQCKVEGGKVTILADYIKTLNVGEHDIVISSGNKTVGAKITVKAVPQTGDAAAIILVAVSVISLAGIAIAARKRALQH